MEQKWHKCYICVLIWMIIDGCYSLFAATWKVPKALLLEIYIFCILHTRLCVMREMDSTGLKGTIFCLLSPIPSEKTQWNDHCLWCDHHWWLFYRAGITAHDNCFCNMLTSTPHPKTRLEVAAMYQLYVELSILTVRP